MKVPNLINVETIKDDISVNIDDKWVRARPEPYYAWWRRFVLAYGVFIGKYDALFWYKQ